MMLDANILIRAALGPRVLGLIRKYAVLVELAALALGCPIWTADQDFFGCGVATWTTDRVELYLADAALH